MIEGLKAARRYQEGKGPLPPYSTIRQLEKRKLIYVYRKHDQYTDYPVSPTRTVNRPTIFAITLTYDGLQILQQTPDDQKGGWFMD